MTSAYIIEDFIPVANTWKEYLFKIGFENVLIFRNGDEMKSASSDFSPELILLDLELSGGEWGLDIAKKLKAEKQDIRIIVLTILDQKNIIKESFKVGVDGFLSKTSGLAQLGKAIESINSGERYLCSKFSDIDLN